MTQVATQPGTATPAAIFKTGHIGLNVTDLDRSRAFYQQVFGFEVVRDDPEGRFVFLGRDSRPLITLWQQSEGRFDTAAPGLHHLSFEAESLEQVRAVEQVLRSLGAEFAHDGVVPHGEGSDSGGLFFTDPDGIRLEIYTPAGLAGEHTHAPNAAGTPTCGFF
ncbi:VOC family protein [Kitasatospora sp. RB6PN24]|uniref:VOC family protein n=1 Tax=Kitasatospora humi TaxID=2893891 RepID=UPI001E502608|nr:VOC family protein [Kitasatospora humi]MCC9309825.1 VOC family protein [Kitasatospora humi]